MKKILLVAALIAFMPTAATACDTVVVVQQPTMAENLIAMELIWPTQKPPKITTVKTAPNGDKIITTTTGGRSLVEDIFPLPVGFPNYHD